MGIIFSVADPVSDDFGALAAVELSKALGRKLPGKEDSGGVLLADCSRGYNIVSHYLGESSPVAYDIGDVLSFGCEADDAIFRCEAGFSVLSAASEPDRVTAPETAALLGEAASLFDAVVALCPSADFSFAGKLSRLLDGSSIRTVVITRACEPYLSAAARLRRLLPEDPLSCGIIVSGYSSDKVKKEKLCSLDECIDRTEAMLFGVISENERERQICFENTAARLLGEKIPLYKYI